MASRYFNIQSQLSALGELLEFLPTPVEFDIVSRGFEALENFQATTILLQRDGKAFTEARSIFNVLVQDFPEMAYHLGTESCLVVNPDFETGIMRILKGILCRLLQALIKDKNRMMRTDSMTGKCEQQLLCCQSYEETQTGGETDSEMPPLCES